ncbi:MAG: hypothetical protein ACLU0O_06155 [Collinsella sp.]
MHIHREGKDGSLLTLPQLMDMSVDEALDATVGLKKVQRACTRAWDLTLGSTTSRAAVACSRARWARRMSRIRI